MYPVVTRIWIFLFALVTIPRLAAAEDQTPLDIRSIPIADWIDQGNLSEIPWRLEVSRPYLRMDQRIEVGYTVTMSGKNLNESGAEHELFLINRISDADGEWLTPFAVMRQELDQELPSGEQIRFNVRVMVKPGAYRLWIVLYDRKTGRHSVANRRVEVEEVSNDPLPLAYMSLPLAEYPRTVEVGDVAFEQINSELHLPVENTRPIEVHVISALSPPEQWSTRPRLLQRHGNYLQSALDTISQLALENGSMSLTGLDLSRREVAFDQRHFDRVDWMKLREGFQKASSPAISAAALQGRKENGAFFRNYLQEELATGASDQPFRVFIIVASSMMFERGSDLEPLANGADCNCRVYHVRFRLSLNDLFDQLGNFIRPLEPKTYNVLSPTDFRKALADIMQDLQEY